VVLGQGSCDLGGRLIGSFLMFGGGSFRFRFGFSGSLIFKFIGFGFGVFSDSSWVLRRRFTFSWCFTDSFRVKLSFSRLLIDSFRERLLFEIVNSFF